MRKIFLTIIAVFGVALSGRAVTLFSYFCDLAEDYKDGAPVEFRKLGLNMLYWDIPACFKSIAEADAFLSETVPNYSDKVIREEMEIKGEKVITYSSQVYGGVTAIIYLYESLDKRCLIGYDEKRQ